YGATSNSIEVFSVTHKDSGIQPDDRIVEISHPFDSDPETMTAVADLLSNGFGPPLMWDQIMESEEKKLNIVDERKLEDGSVKKIPLSLTPDKLSPAPVVRTKVLDDDVIYVEIKEFETGLTRILHPQMLDARR